jgi:hypothetical protein
MKKTTPGRTFSISQGQLDGFVLRDEMVEYFIARLRRSGSRIVGEEKSRKSCKDD